MRTKVMGRPFLAIAMILAIVAIVLASNVVDAAANSATSTKMSPNIVRLAPGASTVITVYGTGVPTANGVQIGLRYDSTVLRVDNAESVGLFSGGWTLPVTTTPTGEVVMGSFLLYGYAQGTGPVMTFRVTRIGPGIATIRFQSLGGWATQYSISGNTVDPGLLNTLSIY